MFVVLSEGFDLEGGPRAVCTTLGQAFSQICCRAGLNYHFEQIADGWQLVFTDAGRPECSPEPVTSTCVKRAEAQRDLMQQAVDGRLKGWMAVPAAALQQHRNVIAPAIAE